MVSTFTVVAASLLLGQASDVPPAGPQPAPKTYVYSGGVLVPIGDSQKPALSGRDAPDNSRPILSKIRSWFRPGADAPPHIIGGNDTPKATFKPIMVAPETPAAPVDLPRKLPSSQTFTPTNEVRVIQHPASTDAPKIIESKTDAPKTDAPKTEAPKTEAPKTEAPKTEAPKTEAPKTEAPKTEAPKTEAPKTEAPKAGAPKTEVVSNVSFKAAPGASSPILPGNANRIGRDEKFEWVTGQLEVEKGRFVLYYATTETVDPHRGRIQLNPQKIDMTQFRNGDLVCVHGQMRAGVNPVYQLTSADLIERPKR
jgi:uncharacterized cupin superfamily protein